MTASVSLAMFGSSLVSAYWNGAATYYRGILRALAHCGFDVTFYEPDAFDRQRHRDMDEPEWAKVVVYPATVDGVERALARAADADIIVKASGVGVFDELLEAEVPLLRRSNQTILYWDVDAPATLERMQLHAADPFRKQVGRYDVVLTYGGGPPVIAAYERFGARNCVPIYNALDPESHFPVEPVERFSGALGFLGNRLPDREARVREFFLAPAARLPRHRFILGGSGWNENLARTENVDCIGHVFTRDHNAFNCSPLAVLNINRDSMARTGYSPPTRIFEAAGAGACLICDAWVGIEDFLEPGSEVFLVHSGEEVAKLLSDLTPEAALRVGAKARHRLLSEHTYRHRARKLKALLLNRRGAGMAARGSEEQRGAAL